MLMHSQAETPTRQSSNLQQHVLLILLKDSSDVLKDLWGEEVYTTVDDVTHKCTWLLHIMQDLYEDKFHYSSRK